MDRHSNLLFDLEPLPAHLMQQRIFIYLFEKSASQDLANLISAPDDFFCYLVQFLSVFICVHLRLLSCGPLHFVESHSRMHGAPLRGTAEGVRFGFDHAFPAKRRTLEGKFFQHLVGRAEMAFGRFQ